MFYSMRRIGIDQSSPDSYENIGNYWRALIPLPMFSQAILDPKLPLDGSVEHQVPGFLFREDDFDPASRIRRGRIYQLANMQQPSDQHVWRRVAGELHDGSYVKPLFIYDSYRLTPNVPVPRLIAVGSAESLWEVISRPERISTGEFLFVLKARSSFGILPEIEHASVPEQGRAKVIETLGKLADAAHRESPGSIIDRARDAAQWCLATWAASEFKNPQLLHEDLGPLLGKIASKREMVALKGAEIVRRLHSRVKPNEQERHGLRAPLEADAELALNSVAFLVREIGWVNG